MSATEMNKALVLYKNFCSFTDTLRKEANTIPMLFGFSFKEPNYYKPDAKKERAMKNALQDKEAGGDGYIEDDGDFAEEMPEFEDQEKAAFGDEDEYKDGEEEDSDDDYQFDLLGEVKKAEQMASTHGGGRRKTTTNIPKKEKIQVDDFNTAALDDLLGGGIAEKPPQRSGTVKIAQADDEWDPFANKDNNVYGDSQPQTVPDTQKQDGASSNMFGDEVNDMWGGGNNQPTQSQPATKEQQKQQLDDLLGDDDYSGQNNDTSMPVQEPASDYNMLKNLYNTATAAPAAGGNMGMGGQQQNYYNTSMGGGYNDGGNGYNNNYGGNMGYGGAQPNNFNTGGGMGYAAQPQQQPQQQPQANNFNTGYAGGGYNDGAAMGYNNNNNGGGTGYNTSYGAGAGAGAGAGGYDNYQNNAGYGGAAQNTGYNTSAPGGQANQNNDFDPFA